MTLLICVIFCYFDEITKQLKSIEIILLTLRGVANSLNEQDQLKNQFAIEDIEMGSIAEDELLNEKFSVQGTSTGKISGKMKVVSTI
jgi:hypothetical protein